MLLQRVTYSGQSKDASQENEDTPYKTGSYVFIFSECINQNNASYYLYAVLFI